MTTRPTTAAIGLGSNLGDRAAMIDLALRRLAQDPNTSIIAHSQTIETPALTLPGSEPQPPYLNAVAVVETSLTPRELLESLMTIERDAGRDRAAEPRWGARVLDLDILLFGALMLDEPGLILPHPRLHERDFVLVPLAQVWPDARHPRLGRTATELLADLRVSKMNP